MRRRGSSRDSAARRRGRSTEVGMKVHRRGFFFMVKLVAAAATPALGQTVAPAIGANSGTQSAASIPDFSGIWAHLTWPDFEPPLAGPRPGTQPWRRDGRAKIFTVVGDLP